ncbi:MAG: hypothetical protein ABR591_05465 [Candidatus Velthaea sp.]
MSTRLPASRRIFDAAGWRPRIQCPVIAGFRKAAARCAEITLAAVLRPRCQREQPMVPLSVRELVHFYRLRRAGAAARLRACLRRDTRAPGKPSVFAPGQLVRVKDREAIVQTLDEHLMHRGLLWSEQQWTYCGTLQRVQRQVRRIIDDAGVSRTVSATVLLEDVTCTNADGSGGCGKLCPLFFRDEWLEAA